MLSYQFHYPFLVCLLILVIKKRCSKVEESVDLKLKELPFIIPFCYLRSCLEQLVLKSTNLVL